MNKSIENIWKEGFAKENLVIPKIKVLYDKKSISIVEQIINRFKREVYALLPLAVVIFLFNIVLDNDQAVLWGIISAIPCFVWFYLGKRQIESIKNIDYKANSYQYLISIRNKLEKIRVFNKKLTISSVPIMLFPMLVYTYYNQKGKSIGEIFGVEGLEYPIITIFLILPVITLFIYILAEFLFKKDLIEKRTGINTLIHEMEELRDSIEPV